MTSSPALSDGRSGLPAFAMVALGVGLLVAAPRVARASDYKDEKRGFQLAAPSKWKQLPLAPDEKWVAVSFSSDREWETKDPKTNFGERHRPQLDVVVMPKTDIAKKGGVTVSGGDITIEQGTYKDFKDYLDQTTRMYGGGGYFFSKDEEAPKDVEAKFGNMKVWVYEITIDKLANAPKKRWGWAFYADDAIYGLVGDGLIKYEDKIRPDIEAAFRSFKIIPHSAALGGVETGKPGGGITLKDPTKKETPEERKKKRDDEFNAYVAKLKATLPDGWKAKDTEHFVVITHCDDKFTKETVDHAEALRGWLDENFAYMGDDVPGKTVLRICADQGERDSMMKTGGWTSYRFEVTTYKDREHTVDSKLWELNGGLWRRWLGDKAPDLGGRLPLWVNYGLADCVTTAQSKGKSIEFKASGQDAERIATVRRGGKLLTAKDFLTKGTEELAKADDVRLQAECFARYLLCGGATKSAKYKNVLSEYLKNFTAMVKEEDKKGKKDDEPKKEAQTEEEENAQFRERENAWKEKERAVLDKLLEMTFKGWDDGQWDAFNKSYWKDLGA